MDYQSPLEIKVYYHLTQSGQKQAILARLDHFTADQTFILQGEQIDEFVERVVVTPDGTLKLCLDGTRLHLDYEYQPDEYGVRRQVYTGRVKQDSNLYNCFRFDRPITDIESLRAAVELYDRREEALLSEMASYQAEADRDYQIALTTRLRAALHHMEGLKADETVWRQKVCDLEALLAQKEEKARRRYQKLRKKYLTLRDGLVDALADKQAVSNPADPA